jgi:tetratricopeptide (TPR) repeat protein
MICGPARTTSLEMRDVPTSCSDPLAVDLYAKALREYQSYIGDPIATIDEALRQFPDFILGHIFRATLFVTMTERRFLPEAQASLSNATALLPYANPRERILTTAVTRLIEGNWDAANAAFDDVLVDYPRDAFAIQTAHLMDFYRGDSFNLRTRVSRVLPHWNRDVPGYSYILGMHAFGLEECNQYIQAEEAGRCALELEPKDGWAVHAVTHVMEMQGRIEDGIQWLESRTNDWAPNNSFAFHNWWHLALFYLDRGLYGNVLSLYDSWIHPAPPEFLLQLVDATALLWRLHLERVDLGDRATALADNWAARLKSERGFYAFNDLHAMMAFVMAGRNREADHLLDAMEDTARSDSPSINVMMTRDVGLPLCRAIRAFGARRYETASASIRSLRDIAQRFGGSHAQRDILTLTLIEAAIRSGQTRLAQHYIAERTVLRSGGQWGPRLLRRAANNVI